MKEWSKKNELNSFNSWKGLLYAEWYKSVREWKDAKRLAPLPPVEASLDPIHACNLQCEHCNAASYLIKDLEQHRMPDSHLDALVRFLGEWGVKAVCYGGGGEPTMHPYLTRSLYLSKEWGMDVSIATNGTLFNTEMINAMALNCRWVGVSVDAATSKTYMIGRKMDAFDKALYNIEQLVARIKELNSKCEVAFKFLIFDYNQEEIYEACKLAKSLGVKDFHARPADFSHQGMGTSKKKYNPYNLASVLEQFERCHELETEDFRVFTVVHKFDTSFKPRKDFSQCYASPCCIQLCADGNIYLCPDQRHQEYYKLGTHYPDPTDIKLAWGSRKHYDLVFYSGKERCKTRCTFAPYCRQCEELFIKDTDPMCWRFI